MVPDASDLAQLYAEAVDIAQSVRQPVTTAHCLLALFTFENRAEVLLKERGIDEDRLLEALATTPKEPPDIQRSLPEKARELAKRVGSDEADCLHLLIALTGMKQALAFELLERCGVQVSQLRNTALSYYTGRMPRKLQNLRPPVRRPPLAEPMQHQGSGVACAVIGRSHSGARPAPVVRGRAGAGRALAGAPLAPTADRGR